MLENIVIGPREHHDDDDDDVMDAIHSRKGEKKQFTSEELVYQ